MKALEVAGYAVKPTVENLVSCFKDYVDAGVWHNLHLDEDAVYHDNGEELNDVKSMARSLIRYCRR